MKPIISTACRIRYPDHFKIGDGSIVDDYCYIAVRFHVGIGSHVASGCNFGGGNKRTFTLGDFSGIASGATVLCGSSDFVNGLVTIPPPGMEDVDCEYSLEGDVTFGDCTGLGSNSLVMPDNVVPEGTVIGALSFVPSRFSFLSWSVYAGNPIRHIKARNRAKVLRQVELYRKAMER